MLFLVFFFLFAFSQLASTHFFFSGALIARYPGGNLQLPHKFPRERGDGRGGKGVIIPAHHETPTAGWLPTKFVRTNTSHLSG